MTTDTVAKTAVAPRDGWSVGGMAKGAGMLAPALATMLVVRHHGCRRRRPPTSTTCCAARPRRPSTGSTPTAACRPTTPSCCSPRAPPASSVGRDHLAEAVTRGLRRPRPPAGRRRRGRPPRHRGRGALARHPSTTPSRWPARWPATTCSSARSSATTPTGAGCSPRSARRAAAFDPASLDVTMNGVQVCRAGGVGEDRSLVDLTGREVHVVVDLHAGEAAGDDLDQRPHPRLRARELRLLHLSDEGPTDDTPRAGPARRDRRRRPARRPVQGDDARRGAALARAVPRRAGRRQVRRQRDGRRRAQGRLRPGHRVPPVRRPAPGRRARRRPADQGDARPARPRQRVQGRPAGHHPRGHGRRADGAHRPGRARARRPAQPARPDRRRPLRRGRRAVRRPPARRRRRRRGARHRAGRRRRRGRPRPRCSTCSRPAGSRSSRPSPPTSTSTARCSTSTPTPPPPRWPSRCGARKLVVLTDVEGVYASWPDRDSLLSELSVSAARELLDQRGRRDDPQAGGVRPRGRGAGCRRRTSSTAASRTACCSRSSPPRASARWSLPDEGGPPMRERRPGDRPRRRAWLDRYEGALLNLFGRPQLVLEHGDGAWVVGRRRPALPRPASAASPSTPWATTTRRSSRPCRSRPASSCTCRTSSPRCRRSSSPSGCCRSPARPAGSAVFFCNSGAEAIEAAIKLARRTGRTGIVAAEGAFHGRTTGALALTHKPAYREPFEPLIPGVTHVPCGDVDALRAAVTEQTSAAGARADPGRGGRASRPRRTTCARPARSPATSAPCSCSTRCRPASAAPAPGSPTTRPASCPTR